MMTKRVFLKFPSMIFAAILPFTAGCEKSKSGRPDAEAIPQTNNGQPSVFVTPRNIILETNELHPIKPNMNFDQEMIQIVRDWYTAKNLEVPGNIVVHDRGTNLWRIIANPNYPAEMWFEIDPSAKHVIRAVGD